MAVKVADTRLPIINPVLPDILVFDAETTVSRFYGFRPGKQLVRSEQLCNSTLYMDIICIHYGFTSNPDKIYKLECTNTGNSHNIMEQFDKIVKQTQDAGGIVVGKNNVRFDNKVVNTIRLMEDLPPMPEWVTYTDDLEKQIRKFFYLPSYSLHHLSKMLGFGGKDPMEFSDWVEIFEGTRIHRHNEALLELLPDTRLRNKVLDKIAKVEYSKTKKDILDKYDVAFPKMNVYCTKDVKDTIKALLKVLPHCALRRLGNTRDSLEWCPHCLRETFARKNGTRKAGSTIYQQFKCDECGRYMGRATLKKNGQYGALQWGI